ncbi:2,4-dienoyl-CoA reductase-like NADH-dependent reductase (Old Yellow Enzyme family) [Lactobacillus colini]|uniref:2,4-dienoyl-CoA reductase-like NADH-dependent reductase (Old Yellow Enzyme family) n=1 Tax=Lactobacillus colini TaxID=1819254 RepID=A0ABS4MFD6_9LACO|nr:NADH:flavin oxidoreductase/NADH oxidase family protein [Lactobacillus colini]MBP2058383.1 2,4-dienoyl-CoA reductase-like NADH-dependent reductase (Old Yellow Enzyme family) [Lactobacillus colini]
MFKRIDNKGERKAKMKAWQQLTFKSGLNLKNRLVKAATSETLGDSSANPTPQLINLYRKWSEGGIGMIISGNVMVDRTARGEVGNVVVDDQTNLNLLKKWAAAGKSNNSHMLLQLNHPGRQAPKTLNPHPVAPSSVALKGDNAFGFNPPRALTLPEIKEIIAAFGRAAQLAEQAGFSGVEIHAAHGYLLNQFLSPAANKRTDAYGGSLENRMRIVLQIYDRIRSLTSSSFTVGIKINSSDFTPDGFTVEDSLAVMKALDKRGIDFIEISGGSYEQLKMMGTGKGAMFIKYSKTAKKEVTAPIIVTGGFRTAEGIEQALASNATDLVGLARPIVLNPTLPNDLGNNRFSKVVVPHFSTGWSQLDKKVGSIVGLAYYEEQMDRLTKGKEIKQPRTAWPILAYAFRKQGLGALMPRRG